MKSRAEHLRSAQAVLDGAKAAGRDLTSSEQATVQGHFDQIEAIDARAKSAEVREADALMNEMKRKGAAGGLAGDVPDMVSVKSGLVDAIQTKSSFGFNMPFTKAAITTGQLLGYDNSGHNVSDVPLGEAVVALRDLFQTSHAESGRVRYYTIGDGAAGVVAEGGLKPDLGADITPHDADLVKIATTFSFTDELIEDAQFMVEHIRREAMRAVLVEENVQVVAALDGATGAGSKDGPLADAIDVVAEAIGEAQAANGVNPTALVLHPSDLASIRTAKASTAGSYFVDPLTTAPSSVHGVPLTATPAVAQGSAYLLSPGVGLFYTRNNNLRVETGYTGDDWIHNRVTTRVEERVLPVVVRPSLLTKVTFTTV